MSVKVRCPECESVAAIPDKLVGRKLQCSKCGEQFVASPQAGAKSSATMPSAGAVTVVARRVGGRPAPPPPPPAAGGSFLWPVAAVFALLLPIAFAAGFAYLKWDKGDHGSPVVAAGGGTEVGGGGGGAAAAPRELYGAIEIGSKGVKYTCFELSADRANELNPTPVADDSTDTNIVQGMDKTGRFDTTRLNDSVAAARKFYDELTKNRGVAPERVFIVGSSGLAGAVANRTDLQPAEKDDLIAKNRKELGDAIRNAIGKDMGFVTVDEEARHQIEGVVPRADLDVSLLIDAGSGSTRGGYREGSGIVKTLKGPGVTEFQGTVARAVKERGAASFADVAAALAEEQLRKPLRGQVESRPGLRAQDKVYLVGGIVWVMATYLHPEKCDAKHSYIGLSADDITRFADTVRANPDCLASFTPPDSLDAESRKKMEDDIRRMRKNFGPEALLAGAEVLKALSAELDFAKKKEMAFCRHGNVAWVMDYVAAQAKLKK